MRRSLLPLLPLVAILTSGQITIPIGGKPPKGRSQLVTLPVDLLYAGTEVPPDGAVLETAIDDLALAGAGRRVASDRRVVGGRSWPIEAAVAVDPARMLPLRRYAVSARILDASGKPLWSAAAVEIFSLGDGVQVTLKKAVPVP